MQHLIKTSLISGLLLLSRIGVSQDLDVGRVIRFSEGQIGLLLEETRLLTSSDGRVSPRTLDADGRLHLVAPTDWTSGFFPGILWQLYAFTEADKWLDAAREMTTKLENEKFNGRTHDMGFKIYCSYGQGYRLTEDPRYRDVIVQAARTLATRFNPNVGCIRSWDHNSHRWDFPVIIDNMLNLELLFAATKLTGDSSFYYIAVSHANTTLKNHFRPDGGSYHVIDYHPETGEVAHRNTHQGYSDESTWARGQAWALYGYTMCYRETKDEKYRHKALAIAQWLMRHPHMPADGVPYWDFDAPKIPDEPRDASAAAVIASGLYELCTFTTDSLALKQYADHVVHSLATHYKADADTHHGFVLLHSTGSKPAGSEVDVPLVYADYYFLEALSRKQRLERSGDPSLALLLTR
ncbi:glycoside hydrolase family 88 protein [Parapedobacter koreensis]|uniref:Glycosyl Hydrolase Family 88 n=1 Tax=Parapedobacter koreensis TaxID=332977 RepID=A0A1H7SPE5_9SPHI|nr:glycoside hydrolase family 88 protein [Parapedobacter koreensis]SEL74269.1 Glycosyl Hydrolase Family 88 [Parapedobacter koreensis]